MSNKTSTQYAEGYAAYPDKATNPYVAGTQEYLDWQEGYTDASEDDEEDDEDIEEWDGIEEKEENEIDEDDEEEDEDE